MSCNTTTIAPAAAPELTKNGIISIVLIIVFIFMNVSGIASSIAALCFTANIFYWSGVIDENHLWAGFSNKGVINLVSISILVGVLRTNPVVKKAALFCFGGDKNSRTWQMTKILAVTYVVALFLPNGNHVQLFTPLIRLACDETGLSPQHALMPMAIVANIANGLLIASSSNLILGGLYSEKVGQDYPFFEAGVSNFPASAITTLILIFLPKLFFPTEMEQAEGTNDDENGEKSSSGGAALAKNPLNEKYTFLFQVFDTRKLVVPGSGTNTKNGDVDAAKELPPQATNNVNDPTSSLIGLTEKAALGFLPSDLLSRLQVKFIDRKAFDVAEGGENDDDEDDSDIVSEMTTNPVTSNRHADDVNNNNNNNNNNNQNKKPEPTSKSTAPAFENVVQDNSKEIIGNVLDDEIHTIGAPSTSEPESATTNVTTNNDQHQNLLHHHHHTHHGHSRSPSFLNSAALQPSSPELTKEFHHVPINEPAAENNTSINNNDKDNNNKNDAGEAKVVDKVAAQEKPTDIVDESSLRIIEKDDIISVRGTLKDLRIFRTLLGLAYVGVADIGRGRQYLIERRRNSDFDGFSDHHGSQKHNEEVTLQEAIGDDDLDDVKPNVEEAKKSQKAGTSKAANDGDVQHEAEMHHDHHHHREVSVPTEKLTSHEYALPRAVSAEDVSHKNTQELTLAAIHNNNNNHNDNNNNNSNKPESTHKTGPPSVAESADVVGAFRNSSMFYLRHASGARYNVKACALYHRLDAFQPATSESSSNTHIFVAIASQDNPALGERIESRIFVEQFGCAVLAVKPYRTHEDLLGRELAWHRLEAGDTLVVRVRPKSAYLWRSALAQRAFFDIIAPPGMSVFSSAENDQMLTKNYIEVPFAVPKWIGQRSVTMRGRVVNLIRIPVWYENYVPILIFLVFIGLTMGGLPVTPVSFICIALLIWTQTVTVRDALLTADFKIYCAISFAIAIGSGIGGSGLAGYVGQAAGNSGVEGFSAVLLAHTISGLVSCIVGNQASPTILFPVVLKMVRQVGIPDIAAATIVANGCVSGFMTTFGLPANLIVAGPGNYSAAHFAYFGTPVFVVYILLSSVFTTIQYGLW